MVQSPGHSEHVCYLASSWEKRVLPIVEVTAEWDNFTFGAWKLILLGMRRFRFISATFWEPATFFKFIYWFITKAIQARRTRHAGHCWRSKDEIVSDILLWTPAYGQSKAGRPALTYIQQLCDDTGCNPEDLPEVMNDREMWRERVRDIRDSCTTWWWWWWFSF